MRPGDSTILNVLRSGSKHTIPRVWSITPVVGRIKGVGDVHDVHAYPGPDMPPLEYHRAAVLGEFGGLGLPVEGHVWQDKGNWGYRSYEDAEAYQAGNYVNLVTRLLRLKGQGIGSSGVYPDHGLRGGDKRADDLRSGRDQTRSPGLWESKPWV